MDLDEKLCSKKLKRRSFCNILVMQEWQGINKTDAAALAGRFGLACPVYQIIDAPVVSTVLCTTKLADLQVLGRRCQSQSGGHCLSRQSIARI